MTEVKVQCDTKVILSTSEEEAGKLKKLLYDKLDFAKEPWAREIHDSLDDQAVAEHDYVEAGHH